ncbi:P-loop containing nucleoside triphosphate hydrolase protein [Coemansia spiralis]|nr:P-loop containing nucleoside triphosphate hydrolase protein [Coemansia spiralis]
MDKDAQFKTSKEVTSIGLFNNLGLKKDLLKGVYAYGFEKPLTIQQRVIPPITLGRSVIIQANPGADETGALCISILQRIDMGLRETQALVLSPTRELAMQTQMAILMFGQYMDIQCYTHTDTIQKNISGQHVVLGTPVHVYNMLSQRILKTDNIKLIVLDMADQLFKLDFINQVNDTFKHLSPTIQVVLLSEIITHDMLEITQKFITNPVHILVKHKLTLEGTKQFVAHGDKDSCKFDILCNIYSAITNFQSVIFCNTRAKVDLLACQIKHRGYAVLTMHTEMNQEEQHGLMQKFRNGDSKVLITTDTGARGIDGYQVPLVINYDICITPEDYIHRVGRSEQSGHKGVAVNFVDFKEIKLLKNIEQFYGIQIEDLPDSINKLIF